MTILACDLGGTNTRVQLARFDREGYVPLSEEVFLSADYDGLTPILDAFLNKQDFGRPDAACIGVAGPVIATASGQSAQVTNLPWELDSAALQVALNIPRVALINDFQAVAYGIETLTETDVAILQPGAETEHGPRAVIGAGTGLGEALMFWSGNQYEVIASEGGHVEFGPIDDDQIALLRHVQRETPHVSYEWLLSGSGLGRIFEFLKLHHQAQESPSLREAMGQGDPAAAISDHALRNTDPLAVQALDLFIRIYGAQAGNLALTCMPSGGIYIAGGIAPKIIERMRSGPFMQAFRNKGRHAGLMEAFPVKVILNSKVGLQGAAAYASRLRQG